MTVLNKVSEEDLDLDADVIRESDIYIQSERNTILVVEDEIDADAVTPRQLDSNGIEGAVEAEEPQELN